MIVTIDPGRSTGIAWGTDAGTLIGCAEKDSDGPIPHAARNGVWVRGAVGSVTPAAPMRAIVEVPDRVERGIPLRDILKLATTAGRWIERCSVYVADPECVYPSAWKGMVPKSVMLGRIVAELDPRERALLAALALPRTREHNVIDAIGIYLWAVGRLGRHAKGSRTK